jgi:transcriptional regulator with XRE-family HTH domain
MRVNRDLVRELRLKRSWSQEKLAEEAGVSPRTIQRVEADGVASLQTRRALAQALGVQASTLRVAADARQSSAATTPSTVYLRSTSGFRIWSTSRIVVLGLLWTAMALMGVSAFVVAFGGVFFWESTSLSASQSAGGGVVSALLLVGVLLLVRWPYKVLRRVQIVRQEAFEAASE